MRLSIPDQWSDRLARGAIVWMLALAVLAGWWGSGCRPSAQPVAAPADSSLYTCGMHPQVLQNKPGNCPICGMKLTPVRKGDRTSSTLTIDPVTAQNMDLRTGVVTRGPLRRGIRTVGVIDFDETTLADVSTKFRGWVEKLYVDATGKQMHRGDPLFEIYSPELFLAQTEYLLTLSGPTNRAAHEIDLRRTAAGTKLRYWDISEEQIAQLEQTRQPKKTLQVMAPRDGVVIEKMVVEGQMVEAGMKLYRLADLATVWIQAQVYEQDLPLIHLGQEALVTVASQADAKFRGRVTYIYPTVDERTRTARVRMEFHNPGYFLKPGMYATVDMAVELSASALLVPDMAVLRTGQKNVVFVALEGGHFEPRTVGLGARADGDLYEILSGLSEGDRVVTSGQFMLDSESQLREAIQKMVEPAAFDKGAHETTAAGARTNDVAMASQNPVYICPMPEHVSLEYDHSGQCPLCGMALVPVSREMLSKIQPGGRVEHYTCPMPEHSDVRQDKSGKCPRCGMTLIPVMLPPPPAIPSGAGETKVPSAPVAADTLYTCPMAQHADVVLDHPGRCPKCEMELVETSKVRHGKEAEENWHRQHPAAAPAEASKSQTQP